MRLGVGTKRAENLSGDLDIWLSCSCLVEKDNLSIAQLHIESTPMKGVLEYGLFIALRPFTFTFRLAGLIQYPLSSS